VDEIGFDVQGSAPEPYRVTFVRRSQVNFSAYCTCPAGINGQYCKHRFAILAGVKDGIVSNNIDDIKVVQSWLPGTDIESALNSVRGLENEAERIKKALTASKHALARAMRD
jgi:uncharacterized Zn finger protein